MKIAIYSRKSKFTGKGDSIENQIEMCKNYMSNMKIDGEFIIYEDEGFTGGNLDRPRFKDLMKDIKSNKINILVCYRLDRISRNVADFSSTLEILQSHECDFISIKEQFDTSTPMGRAMIYIASVFSQLERETIAERVKDNMLELAKNGRWSGGQFPLGFTSEKVVYDDNGNTKSFSKLVPIETEIDIVTFVYSEFLKCGSQWKVTKLLNERGIKGKNNCDFDRHTVKRILRSPLYVKSSDLTHDYLKEAYGTPNGNGYLTYDKDSDNPIVAVAAHKGIILDIDWLSIQSILDGNILSKSNRTGTGDNISLFSGLIKCKHCGDNMTIKHNSKNKDGVIYLYYRCSSKNRMLSKCPTGNLRVDKIDEKLIHNIKNYNSKKLVDFYNKLLGSIGENSFKSTAQNIGNQIEVKNKQVNNLIIQLSNTQNDTVSKIIMDQVTSLTVEIDKLKEELSKCNDMDTSIKSSIINVNDTLNILLNFNKSIDSCKTVSEKRILIRSVTDKIIYDYESNSFEIIPLGVDNMLLGDSSECTYTLNTYNPSSDNSIGENLKEHRLSAKLTQEQLANLIGLKAGTTIKEIELNRKFPSRETSLNLSSYFKLDSKYFYDSYLENTDNISKKLKDFRGDNTIKFICNKYQLGTTAWGNWERNESYPSRNIYKKIKEIIGL